MRKFIEFNWEKNYLYIIILSFLMSFRMIVNFSDINKSKENLSATIIFDLITECSLSFSIFLYIIEKSKIKKKNNNNLKNELINVITIKKYNIYILPKSSGYNIILILILIAFTSFFRFLFSVINYYICLNNFDNYDEFSNTIFNIFLILNTCILSFLKNKITKKKFYLHNIVSTINILFITIIIVIIYYKIHFPNINTKKKDIFLSSIIYWPAIFICFGNFYIYKILIEKYFVSIYALNTIEGIYITIYTIFFYYLFIKKEKENAFDFNKFFLILSCIMQLIINSIIKYIIYIYDEIHTIIAYFLKIFFDSVVNIIKGIYKNDSSQLKLNLLLIIPNLYLIFFLLVFIEIIIIKVCNMEKKTNKYLHIFEIEEYDIPDKIIIQNSSKIK